jgi:uridine kinase
MILDQLHAASTNGASETGRALPFVLGIVGDSGSGKNTLADGVRALIGEDAVTNLELDDYHRYTRAERAQRGITSLNPMVHNLQLMQEHLRLLRGGRPIRNRSYNHADGSFGPIRVIEPQDVVLVRGLLGFPTDKLRGAYDLAIFLDPEPDLLFRWKLRRDTRSRGYTEAEVLMYIAQHLLDSKQYVRPQAERADVVVRYELPEYDAPDCEVRTCIVLRRGAAGAVRDGGSLDRFNGGVEMVEGADQVELRISPTLAGSDVDAWARERFPETYSPERVGAYATEEGASACGPQLMFTQVLIARLAQRLRRMETAPI